jgi:hypothetical protein
MTKVAITLEAGRAPERMDLTPSPLPLTFVYGIGKAGMTPFEYELSETPPGGSVSFSVAGHELDAFSEHLCPPLPPADPEETIHFKVRIDNVAVPSGRELIKAMADMAGGCSCGCGCGGH